MPSEDFSPFPCGQARELAPVCLNSSQLLLRISLCVSAANRKLTVVLGESQE